MFKIDVVQIFDLVQLSSGYNFAVLPLVQWVDVSAKMVDTIMLNGLLASEIQLRRTFCLESYG